MIAVNDVVEILRLPVFYCRWADVFFLELGDRLGQETLRCRDIAFRGEIKVQGLPTGGDRPVEVTPLPTDADVGLIHPPGTGLLVRNLSVLPSVLIQFRVVFLDPAVDGGVIDRHATLSHHLFEISVAHPVAAVPPDRPQDDFSREMTTGEDIYGCDYFTQVFLMPQLCNSTGYSQIDVIVQSQSEAFLVEM